MARHLIVSFNDKTRSGCCSVCGPIDIKVRNRPQGTYRECMTKVRSHSRTTQENRQKNGTRRVHGLTVAEVAAIKESQGYACAICQAVTDLVIDHDHNCHPGLEGCAKCVRGALCHACNIGLGFLRDDPDRLRSAIGYLTKPRHLPS